MSVTITDRVGILTAQERADLEVTVAPFRVKALFESVSKPELQQHVRSCVDSPSTVCIGVDPVHRFTWTEIGIDTGIRSGDYQQVGRAGNGDFKAGHWGQGVQAIVSRGAALAQQKVSTTPVIIQQPQTVIEKSVSPWPFVIGGGILLVTGVIMWRILRKQHRATEEVVKGLREERFEYASKNVDRMAKEDFDKKMGQPAAAPKPAAARTAPANSYRDRVRQEPAPPPPAPPPAQVIVERDSGFTDGLILGSILNRPAAPAYEPRRERTPEPSRSSGGGGFFDSFSSSSSSDSGGGGGGDFGGGDSGGGGGGDF